jgi:hypothetical protein
VTIWPGNRESAKNCTHIESTLTSTLMSLVDRLAFPQASTWVLSTTEGWLPVARLKDSNLHRWQAAIKLAIKSLMHMVEGQRLTKITQYWLAKATLTTTLTSKAFIRIPWTLSLKLAKMPTLPRAKSRLKRTELNQLSNLKVAIAVNIPPPRSITQKNTSKDLDTNSTPSNN